MNFPTRWLTRNGSIVEITEEMEDGGHIGVVTLKGGIQVAGYWNNKHDNPNCPELDLVESMRGPDQKRFRVQREEKS